MTSKWRPIAERISALGIDDSFDIPDYANHTKSIARLRGGIGAVMPLLKFLVRAIPKGGIRIIKTGNWGSAFRGIEGYESQTVHPVLNHRKAKDCNGLRPGGFFLGFLANSSMHRRDVPKYKRCNMKACPFPSFHMGFCREHTKYFTMDICILGNAMDRHLLFGSEENRWPLLHSGFAFELQRDDFCFEYRGVKRWDLWKAHS